MFKGNKENAIFIGLLFLLSIIFLHSIVSTTKIMNNIHHVNDVTFVSQNIKESVFNYGQLHLWTPYYYSGRPLYAQPEYYSFDLNFLYILLFRDIYIAMNLATISYFFLSGLGMYLLFLVFNENKFGAFIAAIVYMFNGYMHSFVINGNLNVLAGYSLIPFAFMFFVKALQKNMVKNSIFSAIFVALQVFAGGTLLIPYEIILFGVYSLFYLFGKDVKTRALNLIFAAVLIAFFSFGISAVKLLPGIEFMELSNRGMGVSYQEYLGEPIELGNIFHILVSNLFSTGTSASIGIMAFILLLASLFQFKKRYIIFSLALLLFSMLMATKGIIADLFYNLPIFNQLRHIERAVFLAAFASSILAGAGYVIFSEKARNFLKIKINKELVIFSAVFLFIIVELMFLQRFPNSIGIVKPDDIEINKYIMNDKEMFRTINLAVSTLIGATGYNYLSQAGISELKGGGGIWFNDYIAYLSVAEQIDSAKLWGMLNNKYAIAKEKLDINGLKFIGEFKKCEKCPITEVEGPYLYENLEFMPRAYFVDKAILVVANEDYSQQIIYSLLLKEEFDPKKSVIIKGRQLSSYSPEELNNYDAVIVSGSATQQDIILLNNYIKNGGILLPDILNNKNSITEEDIKDLFTGLNGNFEEVKITSYENNKADYDVDGKKGFLVLSETFANFPGWEATSNGKKDILKANGIITAVSISGDKLLTLEYKPKSFIKGLWISLITLVILIGLLAYIYKKNIGGKNKT